MFRLSDILTSVPNETRLVVRLGRAILPGEIRVQLSLLRMGETEVIHPVEHNKVYFHSPYHHSPVLQATNGLHHNKGYDCT